MFGASSSFNISHKSIDGQQGIKEGKRKVKKLEYPSLAEMIAVTS